MKKLSLSVAMSISLMFILANCTQTSDYDLAIENVDVYDSKTKEVYKQKTILIKADTIAAVIENNEIFQAKKTILGKGRLIVPGFIDTHTHLMQNYGYHEDFSPTEILPENFNLVRGLMSNHYLSHGVTTIIDMAQPESWIDVTLKWQNDPQPNYPNLFICGGSIVSDEDRFQPQHHIEVLNPEDGRKKVRTYAEKGIKHMKLYRKLRKPDMIAMVDEAEKYDIVINTHVDNNVVTIGEAMDYGISNFEHIFTLTPSVLNYDEHWKKMNEEYGIQMTSSIDEFTAHMVFFFSYIKSNPTIEAKLFKLFDRMAKEGANISTALNVLASSVGKTDFFTSFEFYPMRVKPGLNYTSKQQEQLEKAFEILIDYMKIAHEKGVKIRIGTDSRFGGKGLIKELQLLTMGGFSVADVLQIATLNGYEAMELDDDYGSIEVGKKADLVIFDKNPFDNIENFTSDKTVIKGGKLFSNKKSLAYALQAKIISNGLNQGMDWYDNMKESKDYNSLNSDELTNIILEFLGDGRIDEFKRLNDIYTTSFQSKSIIMDGTVLTNAVYASFNKKGEQEAINFYKFSQNEFPDAQMTVGLNTMMSILMEGVEKAEKQYHILRKEKSFSPDENEMNNVGYLLLQLGKTKEAISIFKLNSISFPNSWNTFDSLAEGYLTDNNKIDAIKNYQKSIELNPDNENGKKVLLDLKSKKKP